MAELGGFAPAGGDGNSVLFSAGSDFPGTPAWTRAGNREKISMSVRMMWFKGHSPLRHFIKSIRIS
jgi:hypothetical protein